MLHHSYLMVDSRHWIGDYLCSKEYFRFYIWQRRTEEKDWYYWQVHQTSWKALKSRNEVWKMSCRNRQTVIGNWRIAFTTEKLYFNCNSSAFQHPHEIKHWLMQAGYCCFYASVPKVCTGSSNFLILQQDVFQLQSDSKVSVVS